MKIYKLFFWIGIWLRSTYLGCIVQGKTELSFMINVKLSFHRNKGSLDYR